MIRITGINRKVEIDKGCEVSDVNCTTLLIAGNDTNYNKARFRLTDDEAKEFDDLTRKIEQRIADSVVSQVYVPVAAPTEEGPNE